MRQLSPVFLYLDDWERAHVRTGLRKPAKSRTAAEIAAIRKYWRSRKKLEREGRKTCDCRVNEKYRMWLKKHGFDPDEFDGVLYQRWVREGRP